MKERDKPPPTRHLIGLRETKSNLDVIRVDVTRPRLVKLNCVLGETRPYTRHVRASVGVRVRWSACEDVASPPGADAPRSAQHLQLWPGKVI